MLPRLPRVVEGHRQARGVRQRVHDSFAADAAGAVPPSLLARSVMSRHPAGAVNDESRSMLRCGRSPLVGVCGTLPAFVAEPATAL